jgi:hypothetical protein
MYVNQSIPRNKNLVKILGNLTKLLGFFSFGQILFENQSNPKII